tara:strand:- start:229 stop:1920 length:1692 start_codon:yes stop_codon:yes gene_type:complete
MAGGLLNLIAYGNQNIIMHGNPTKSFFKTKYVKYTNFGLQKFRIDQFGQTNLSLSKPSNYTFKISRYGDLLMDTYLVFTLPKIWSPILKYNDTEYRPYQFKWIKNIGTEIIKEITFTIGGHIIQKFSGSFLKNIVERDFNSKKEAFNIMIGNHNDLIDPANFSNRDNNYPNAFRNEDNDTSGCEPSIPETQIYVPINTWYNFLSTTALPLICLQYAELEINFTLRPIEELFVIKDVAYDANQNEVTCYENIPYIQPKQSQNELYGFYRFINEPPVRDISINFQYKDTRMSSNFDVHLMTTQCFLDNEERSLFAENSQEYLIREVHEYDFEKINKSNKIKLESYGLVSNWMWYFQRNDVFKRNEWSNYSNWPYEYKLPNDLIKLKNLSDQDILYPLSTTSLYQDVSKNIYITGPEINDFSQKNFRDILKNFAIICDGKYRENSMPAGIYDKIEKYSRTTGSSINGLYFYNFCLTTDPLIYQPNGVFNTNKFKNIEFEYNLTDNPPFDLSNVNFSVICDPDSGEVIATSKEPTSIYRYNYNLHIYEERYNILKFQSGTASLVYSR